MKRIIALIVVFLLIATGCTPMFEKEEEIVQNTEDTNEQQEKTIIPKYNISDDYYKTILPFKPSETRGFVNDYIYNRLDIDEFEMGLMRISQDTFSPEKYLFQEGQYITGNMVRSWLRRYSSEKPQGLNPPQAEGETASSRNEASPEYLSYVLEQNFFEKVGDGKVELRGVVIGVSLNTVHYYKQEQGYPREYAIDSEQVEKKGKEIAETILQRVRTIDELEGVKIVVALFREEKRGSIVPGTFFAKTVVDENKAVIDKWQPINEKYYFFPSDKLTKDFYDQDVMLMNFKKEVDEYFPNYNGVIGTLFYKNDQLTSLQIEIPMQFYGKAEVIGFTQYVKGLVMKYFPPYFSVQVNITSIGGQESLITRGIAEEEPFVHVYK